MHKNGYRSDIPATAVDSAFKKNVTYFLAQLESGSPPHRVPSPRECRYCEITAADCPERIEWNTSSVAAEDPIPSIDWEAP